MFSNDPGSAVLRYAWCGYKMQPGDDDEEFYVDDIDVLYASHDRRPCRIWPTVVAPDALDAIALRLDAIASPPAQCEPPLDLTDSFDLLDTTMVPVELTVKATVPVQCGVPAAVSTVERHAKHIAVLTGRLLSSAETMRARSEHIRAGKSPASGQRSPGGSSRGTSRGTSRRTSPATTPAPTPRNGELLAASGIGGAPLKVLDLSGSELRDSGVGALVDAMLANQPCFTVLESVGLSFNQITVVGAQHLQRLCKVAAADALLARQRNLAAVAARRIQMATQGSVSSPTELAGRFMAKLKTNVAEKGGAGSPGDGGSAEAVAVPARAGETAMAALHTIDLSWNNLDDDGAHVVAATIKEHHFLRSVNVSYNGITAERGGRALYEASRVNANLGKLVLDGNEGNFDVFHALMDSAVRNAARKL
jgi:hypothetical protein